MVILSFYVIKPYYLGNYHGTAVNYHGIWETNVIKHNLTEYESKLLRYFKARKVGFYYLGNLPRYCFITLAPGLNSEERKFDIMIENFLHYSYCGKVS